jgi:hypothetical protein
MRLRVAVCKNKYMPSILKTVSRRNIHPECIMCRIVLYRQLTYIRPWLLSEDGTVKYVQLRTYFADPGGWAV